MVFSTQSFLFFFLPLFLGIYFLLPAGSCNRLRNYWLLAGSLVFYGWYEWKLLPLLPVITFVCWFAGKYMAEGGKYRKSAVAAASAISIFTLISCKILAVGGETDSLPEWMGEFVFPLGISFYTFQALSYTFDVYSGRNMQYNHTGYFSFLTGTSMFTQLAAGPVVRWHSLAPQISGRKYLPEKFSRGSLLFMAGFAKKILLADELGMIADEVFYASSPGTFASWLGITAYTLQIYFDFSGYCDMGIGAAMMTGFILPQNFRSPLRSCSIREFWHRWHITLSKWFRDYIYIPMGGNKKGIFRTSCNILTVMLLSGIWHGAGWNFIIFGLLHGAAMVLERMKRYLFPGLKLPAITGWLWMISVVLVSFVFFRTGTPSAALEYLGTMTGLRGGIAADGLVLNNILSYKNLLLMASGIFIAVCTRTTAASAARRGNSFWICLMIIFFAASIIKMLSVPGENFIYFIF